eukprot:TRINITY_DN26792_c0_g1_i1.p1 TRINITY_DN26792_c0_g1~~TRINITY_DN26792_c0_g1_i1.p1  ORF type:complete len:278 (+),score=74.05 TRINITY_DN26792_c0_g1_i1:46-834(+)
MLSEGARSDGVSFRGGGASAARQARSRAAMSRGTRSAVDRTPGNDLTQHPTLSADLCREALSLFDSCGPAPGKGLSVKQLRGLLKDMGLEYTENQVKDLIFRVRQTSSVLKRNTQETERRAALLARTEEENCTTPSSDSTAPEAQQGLRGAPSILSGVTAHSATSSAGEKEEVAFLDRRGFLEVLTLTLEDCDADEELRSTWTTLDHDGDEVLSAKDLAHALSELSMPQQRLEELHESLHQADFDNDGAVTFPDFCRAMDTN